MLGAQRHDQLLDEPRSTRLGWGRGPSRTLRPLVTTSTRQLDVIVSKKIMQHRIRL